jgi:DHA1 family bicyclomycin/chloramphenicol resistance-like MFS transporter
LSFAVFAWAILDLPETRRSPEGSRERHRFRADLAALAASPKFFGYALCAGLGSAPFFSLLGGAPHVVVSMLGRTSAEYGLWFFFPSLGFMAGNFAVARLTARLGIDALIWWGIALTVIGSSVSITLYVFLPGWEMVAIFIPHLVIGLGNGLLMPTAIAGAVSVRPQVAGTASGMTGFIQMTIGAAAAQLSAWVIADASDGVPMLLLMLCFGVATGTAVFTLLRR